MLYHGTAVERATENHNRACTGRTDCTKMPERGFSYTWGRKDCPTSPRTEAGGRLPGASFNHSATLDYFAVEFGLDAGEAVALMGAHTLGGAHKDHSGYEGKWVRGDDTRFNNNFYRRLVDEATEYTQRPVTPDHPTNKHWQLESDKGQLILK